MSPFDKILRGVKRFAEEVNKPDSFVKGEAFEEYVRQNPFPMDRYKLIHRSHDYNTNQSDYVESSLLPDFKFRDLATNKEFFVECKFRSGVYSRGSKIEWCSKSQLHRYLKVHKEIAPVFIALGIGSKAKRPDEIILFNIETGSYTGLYDTFLDQYSFYVDKPVFSGYLWKL